MRAKEIPWLTLPMTETRTTAEARIRTAAATNGWAVKALAVLAA